MYPVHAIISVLLVSLVSVIFGLPLIIHKKVSNKVLLFLLSASVGVLLSTVLFDFFPEILEHSYTTLSGIYILTGFLLMFVLEKFVHYHHSKKHEHGSNAHGHAYHLAPVNLLGDGIHNFIDGLVIAGAYSVNIAVGIAATISVIFHEIPQEIADMGVLLYSGLSKLKALLFNFISALAALLGTILGIFLVEGHNGFTEFILPFAAGNFIYIAAANLTPQLHRHCGLKDTLLHMVAIALGVGVVILVAALAPEHVH